MLRILQRLNRSLTWHLLSPPDNLPPGMCHHSGTEHADLLAALQAARQQVFGTDDKSRVVDPRASDLRAAHYLALDHHGQVAGAIRMFVVWRQQEPLPATLVEGFGRIQWPDAQVRAHQLAALDHWLATQARDPVFVYAGGFFTTERWRGSGLAAVLGIAAVAMARLHGSRQSVTFAATDGPAPMLFSLLGGQPLQDGQGRALDPFLDPRYGITVRLTTFDSHQPHPDIETTVAAAMEQMRATTALAPLQPAMAEALP